MKINQYATFVMEGCSDRGHTTRSYNKSDLEECKYDHKNSNFKEIKQLLNRVLALMATPPIFAELLPFKFIPLNKYTHIKKYHKLLFGGYHVSRISFYSISRGEQSRAGYQEWASHEITRVAMCKIANREWTSARLTDPQ